MNFYELPDACKKNPNNKKYINLDFIERIEIEYSETLSLYKIYLYPFNKAKHEAEYLSFTKDEYIEFCKIYKLNP